MKRCLIGCAAAILTAGGTVLSLGAGMAAAQTVPVDYSPYDVAAAESMAVTSSAQSEFTCPSHAVCTYAGNSFNGAHVTLYTKSWASPPWYSFSSAGVSPNPGSLTDNSGSAIWVFAKDNRRSLCFSGPSKDVTLGAYGWFYITYGTSACGNSAPTPLP